jgi:hypothetical protein
VQSMQKISNVYTVPNEINVGEVDCDGVNFSVLYQIYHY